MGIVNNILNLVDLNTTKYSKKLQGMRRDTKNAAKGIAGSFSSIGSAWKGAIAAIAAGALSGAITKELQATEKSVAAFIQSTGSVADARAQFEMLQQAARDTIQPFDSLKAAALELRKNGLQPSAEQLKTFSQIAYGTGQSLETVSKAFTGTIQGNLRGLRQLGITAQDNGETLLLTYKGATTEIQKNTAALSAYFDTIGKENEGVLDYLQGGVTGALNHLENAWGDFYRALAESGFGDLVTHAIRDIATELDSITSWINENREPIKAFFTTITESWDSIVTATKDSVKIVKDTVNDLWESSGLAAATGTNNMIEALSQFFNFARAGFLEVAKWATNAWTALKGGFQAVGEGIGNWLGGGEFGTAYNRVLNQAADQIGKDTENFNGTINTYYAEIAKNIQRLRDAAMGYTDDVVNYRSWEQGQNGGAAAGFNFPPAGKTGGGGGGGGGRAAKAAEDTWKKYYEGILRIQRDGYSSAEKLRAEHSERLEELEREFAASSVATEAERLAARETLNQDYQRKMKALREEAAEFLRGIGQTEESRVMDQYRKDLEKLDKYHEDALISETEYQEKRKALIASYEEEMAKVREQKDGFLTDKDKEQVDQFSGAMTSLSDAFSNLTQGLSESSRSYKALFAIQKSFAIASATANAIVAWSDALTTKPFFPAGLAAYANAVALTTSIIGQLRGLSMHDKGGRIPAGQLGIVGEKGPELVAGPASVTSRRRTAALAQGAITSSGDVTVNLYEDASRAGQAESETAGDGERVINIFISNIRKGGQAARALESTYQLRRYGS
jgi:hypothetical protein